MIRLISSFLGVLLAIVVAIVIFAPDRIPAGWGYEPTPVDVQVQSDLGGEILGSLLGKEQKNIVISNQYSAPLYNVTINLLGKNGLIKKQYIQSVLGIGDKIVLGWTKQWQIEAGDQLTVAAAHYKKTDWAL